MAPLLAELGFLPGVHFLAVNATGAGSSPEALAVSLYALLTEWLRGDGAADAQLASIAAAGRDLVLAQHTHCTRLVELQDELRSLESVPVRRQGEELQPAVSASVGRSSIESAPVRGRACAALPAEGTSADCSASDERPPTPHGPVPGVGLIRDARAVFLRPSGSEMFEPFIPLMQAWVANVRTGLLAAHTFLIRTPDEFYAGEDARSALRTLGLKYARHCLHTSMQCVVCRIVFYLFLLYRFTLLRTYSTSTHITQIHIHIHTQIHKHIVPHVSKRKLPPPT